MKNILILIRPHQYVKNFFIFLPLFFAGQILNPALAINALLAFIAFSFSASAIYILNDYYDIAEDRLHPKKKNRPLASGALSKKTAILLMLLLAASGIYLMFTVSTHAMVILTGYILLNIAYSFYLKHVAILDISIIAIGFVLRLFVGAAATGIYLSMWIVIMTFLLALFLALAKRRDVVLLSFIAMQVYRLHPDPRHLPAGAVHPEVHSHHSGGTDGLSICVGAGGGSHHD